MRYLLVGLSLLGALLGMQASHELGHVAMALATGASVEISVDQGYSALSIYSPREIASLEQS